MLKTAQIYFLQDVNYLNSRLLHDKREHGVLSLIHELYAEKIQWRSHWSEWSLASCHITEVSLLSSMGLCNRQWPWHGNGPHLGGLQTNSLLGLKQWKFSLHESRRFFFYKYSISTIITDRSPLIFVQIPSINHTGSYNHQNGSEQIIYFSLRMFGVLVGWLSSRLWRGG